MSDNTEKSIRGRSGQENLGDLIISLKEKQYVVDYIIEYRDGYKGFDEKQFFFQYLIEYENKECWLLHSTTSIRSDRMNIQQWNAEHLKRLNGFIKKAFVVYPNGLSEKELGIAKSYQNKLKEGKSYSAVDGVMSQSEIFSLIEKHALSLDENKGKAFAKRGNNFESWIVEILNNSENINKWKNDDKIKTGYVYDVFVKLVEFMDLRRTMVVSINATSDVPKLPSGGKAKTDIIVSVDSFDGEKKYTFSCKKTGNDWVSAHEYTADAFIQVLQINDEELSKALTEFQTVGSMEKMSGNSFEIMSKRMPDYNDRLNQWVLSGNGGAGDPETQWADGIIIYDDNNSNIKVETINEYIESKTKTTMPGNFGTMFRWTYPSGGLGKRIQLKMKVD